MSATDARSWPGSGQCAACDAVSTRGPCYALLACAIMMLAAWNGFWHLGDAAIRDCDEARYGVAASEMLGHHALLVATYHGAEEFWNLKPPLGYWLIEAAYASFGESAWSLRLPAVLCALATILGTMAFARRRFDESTALLAGLILATSFGFFGHHAGRSGELDSPLTLVLLGFLALAPDLTMSRKARLAAGVVLAAGFLLKSFEILPYVAAVMVYGWSRGGTSSWRLWVLPGVVVALTALVWGVARSVAQGSTEFVRRMVVEDLLLRTTAVIDPGQDNSAWDYVGALFDRLAPWPLFVVLGVGVTLLARERGRAPRSGAGRLLWCYALVPLVAFTLARTHHFQYILPTFPAWAIIAASSVRSVWQQAGRRRCARGATVVLLLAFVAAETRVALQALNDRRPAGQSFLAQLRSGAGSGYAHLRTDFATDYAERFVLQVLDGYTVDEPDPDGAVASVDGSAHDAVLTKVARGAAPVAPADGGVLVAAGAGYALYALRDTGPLVEVARREPEAVDPPERVPAVRAGRAWRGGRGGATPACRTACAVAAADRTPLEAAIDRPDPGYRYD